MKENLVNEGHDKKEIIKQYRALLRACQPYVRHEEIKNIRKAFDLALDAHKDMRRRSGEPYILHPLAVAQIVAREIGLGATSIICALLHDTVEDTEITLTDIEKLFGKKVAVIIDGLTKISGVFDQTTSIQAENFRKMLVTLSDDVRVILIKLADRLHNMRTLGSMPHDKQLKICSETSYLYAPLAHRLGLYSIKTEMDDLVLKYTEPEVYKSIVKKLQQTKKDRDKFIADFISPIDKALAANGITNYEVKGRPKSIFSIWRKMKKQNIPFEQVYDLFAIRIILDSPPDKEKADCWNVYSLVTDSYKPNTDRLRDWISTPKANGYESLHVTVMSATGRWVEVQIRSQRMDEVAEKGYAAHWKYKESSNESAVDAWINHIREMLENADSDALDFVDDFKLNLFTEEIFVFTPQGELRTLPAGSTVIDFAYDIHSDLGGKCIGGKINYKLVPLNHKIHSGDQVEILTSTKQKPKEDWLEFAQTARAKATIKQQLREDKRLKSDDGKEILERKLKNAKIDIDKINTTKMLAYFKLSSMADFYYQLANEKIDFADVKDYLLNKSAELDKITESKIENKKFDKLLTKKRGSDKSILIGKDLDNLEYKLSPCCNPIPGDAVYGFMTINEGVKIHRVTCPNTKDLMSNFAYRIVQARWNNQHEITFLAGIRIQGADDVGVVSAITNIISSELKVNMRSISIEGEDGLFNGVIMLFVHNTEHLKRLIAKLKEIPGMLAVVRIDQDKFHSMRQDLKTHAKS
ncbi:MAG: bifunctional (p)ppGpp synthetase/guanosine-3',5'-bis(diphosphate) 3'-pyrophosphohydrolase [Bacteroidetes bacterium]|nr:bifunctional (p)ppGpp synthetase/guanosine-3',5'-bis(diphosphate) 3'-pyrophosphohydrolase [Bacteroidota bacterium]